MPPKRKAATTEDKEDKADKAVHASEAPKRARKSAGVTGATPTPVASSASSASAATAEKKKKPVAEKKKAATPAKTSKATTKKKSAAATEEGEGEGEGASAAAEAKPAAVFPQSLLVRPAPLPHGYLSVISWNVNGLRSILDKKVLNKLVATHKPDLLCIQETKIQDEHIGELQNILSDYDSAWTCCTDKKGYSGSAVFTRKDGRKPIKISFGIGIKKHDTEGRAITVEYDKVYVVALYVPNSGQKLERLDYRIKEWDIDLVEYLQRLERTKPVIVTGDLNVAHLDADIYNYNAKHIKKVPGYTPQERESFGKWLSAGFVDTFRHKHPDVTGWFTYWSARTHAHKTNNGLRLDYFITSKSLVDDKASPHVHDSYIIHKETDGASDHCPIGLVLAP